MKTKKKTKKDSFFTEARNFISLIDTGIVYAFLFCMLAVFPLFYENKYNGIGDVKYKLYANISKFFLIIELILIIIRICLYIYQYFKGERKDYLWDDLKKRSFLDAAVAFYGVCVIISFLLCNDPKFALTGANGWFMGLYSQLTFIGIYFVISWKKQWLDGLLTAHLVSSGIVFALGILHRFSIDPLGMYEGLGMYHIKQFLSTLGQNTWYSSYMCTIFMIGIMVFYFSKDSKKRILSGVYTVICFATFVTQNSDSAFLAIFGIYLLLGYFSLADREKWMRFLQLIIIMFATFVGIGLLQRIFADKVIPLDSISLFFSQSIVIWIALIVSIGFYFLFKNGKKERIEKFLFVLKNIYKILLVLMILGIVGMIIFIYLNTTGYLLEKFGFQSFHNYLFFNDSWGNRRGVTWRICWEAFSFLPWDQKLFGVGPDSVASYLYSIPQFNDFLRKEWGNLYITNAHNEYLNSLLCYGVVGLTSWLTVLIGGIAHFYNKAKKNPFMIAFALCIMGYACHNIFCYQQVCCTPFLFIALGIGESLTKSENFNTIK